MALCKATEGRLIAELRRAESYTQSELGPTATRASWQTIFFMLGLYSLVCEAPSKRLIQGGSGSMPEGRRACISLADQPQVRGLSDRRRDRMFQPHDYGLVSR